MSKHIVTKAFIDKETKERYSSGEVYESSDQERVSFLQEEGYLEQETENEASGTNDDQNAEGDEYPKHTGGGWYELSNGEKVKGKDEAAAAEAKLGE